LKNLNFNLPMKLSPARVGYSILGNARASRADDGALAIANFLQMRVCCPTCLPAPGAQHKFAA